MNWHQIWDTSLSPTATEACILIVGAAGPVDVGRVIGAKERVDAPYQDGSWLPLPPPHWPCIREALGSCLTRIPYTFLTR